MSEQATSKPHHDAILFATVVNAELDQIQARRAAHGQGELPGCPPNGSTGKPEHWIDRARGLRLVGLAFSGGGIRSATFNLGLLQGLANAGLLRTIDYVSTVSGGGYIGSWLAALIHRGGGAEKAEECLKAPKPGDRKPSAELDPVGHLREYSNFLAPRQGFMTADKWVLWASYVRNFLLNQLVLLPFLLAVLIVPRLVMLAFFPKGDAQPMSRVSFGLLRATIALSISFALVSLFLAASQVRTACDYGRRLCATPGQKRWLLFVALGPWIVLAAALLVDADWPYLGWLVAFLAMVEGSALAALVAVLCSPKTAAADDRLTPALLLWRIILPIGLAAFCFCLLTPYDLASTLAEDIHLFNASKDPAHPLEWWPIQMAGFAIFFALLIFLSFAAVVLLRKFLEKANPGPEGSTAAPAPSYSLWNYVAAIAVLAPPGGALTGVFLFGVYQLLSGLYTSETFIARDIVRVQATAAVATFGLPLVLAAVLGGVFVGVALWSAVMGEELREWWSSLSARVFVVAAIWLSLFLVALYGTAAVLWASPWVRVALGSGWLITTLGGVLAGKSGATGNGKVRRPELELLARIAPHLFLAGLIIGVSLLIHALFDNPPNWRAAPPDTWQRDNEPALPPIHVAIKTTVAPQEGKNTQETTRVTEYNEVADEARIVAAMYWLGMLNMDKNKAPAVYYAIDNDVLAALKKDHLSDKALTHLKEVAQLGRFDTREKFEAALPRRLIVNVSEQDLDNIVQRAKSVEALHRNFPALVAKLLCGLVLFIALTVAATLCVDVNVFSLHAVYCNRLVRCYLGASRKRLQPGPLTPLASAPSDGHAPCQSPRRPDPLNEFDPDDDLPLAELNIDGPGYDGPYLLINTALNLVHGQRLDWQERKAESFILAPAYCGSEGTGYRPTRGAQGGTESGYAGNITLGKAVTLSGAAASPNMGYHSSPAVTALLTVFNARLGAWLGNPASPTRWQRAGPRNGFFHILREMFGLTRERGGYVYLSDGGHFENLGVYELVRRRCQYIIVADADCDPDHSFENFGNLVHKCRVDFGIRIDIDLAPLQLKERRTRTHCAVGKIHYEDAMPGTLVYVKPSLTGDEPADVLHYAQSHANFPHQSTAELFYFESQFESYRALGQHIAQTVFEQAAADMHGVSSFALATSAQRHQRRCRVFFASLVRHWFAMPPEYETSFVESTQRFIDVQKELRGDKRLHRLLVDMYPELNVPNPTWASRPETSEDYLDRQCAELNIIVQMFQSMEAAWLSLRLDVHYAHPLNRGWMSVFHRWTNAPTVRRYWPILRAELARGFVSFCEKQMRLGVVKGRKVLLTDDTALASQMARLDLEFRDQWPGEPTMPQRLAAARRAGEGLAWLIYPDNPYPADDDQPADPLLPAGIAIVSCDQHVSASKLPVYEFFVWIRGAYRNTGIGRPAVQAILEQLQTEWRVLPFALRVYLPTEDLPGPAGKMQVSIWETFFNHHEFERVPPQNGSRQGVVLERKFSPAPGQRGPRPPRVEPPSALRPAAT